MEWGTEKFWEIFKSPTLSSDLNFAGILQYLESGHPETDTNLLMVEQRGVALCFSLMITSVLTAKITN